MPLLSGLGHRVLGDLAPLAKIARMSTNPDPTQAVAIKAQARLEWNHPELHIGACGNSVAEAIDAIEELIIGLRGPKVVSINKVTITGGAGTPELLASTLADHARQGEALRAVTQNNAQLEAVLKDIYRVLHAIAVDGPIGNLTPEFVIESVRKTLDTIRGQARAEGDARRKLVDEHAEHSTRIRKALGLAGSPGLASTWPDLLSYLETMLQQLKEAAGGKPTPTVAALAGDMSATLKENERLAGEVTRLSNRVAELEPWQEEARSLLVEVSKRWLLPSVGGGPAPEAHSVTTGERHPWGWLVDELEARALGVDQGPLVQLIPDTGALAIFEEGVTRAIALTFADRPGYTVWAKPFDVGLFVEGGVLPHTVDKEPDAHAATLREAYELACKATQHLHETPPAPPLAVPL